MTIFGRHPVDNPSISQGYANDNGREAHKHLGIDYRPDFPGQVGKIIYAPADMFIAHADGDGFAADNPWEQLPNNGNAGRCIIGVHPNTATAYSLYAHLDEIWVTPGQFVTEGTPIGTMGWTGYILPPDPNGTHLHFEVFIDYGDGIYPEGTFYGRVNPLDYFRTETTVPVGPGGTGNSTTDEDGHMAHIESVSPEAAKAIAKAMMEYVHTEPAKDGKPEQQVSWKWFLLADRTKLQELKNEILTGIFKNRFKVEGAGEVGETTLAGELGWLRNNFRRAQQ